MDFSPLCFDWAILEKEDQARPVDREVLPQSNVRRPGLILSFLPVFLCSRVAWTVRGVRRTVA